MVKVGPEGLNRKCFLTDGTGWTKEKIENVLLHIVRIGSEGLNNV